MLMMLALRFHEIVQSLGPNAMLAARIPEFAQSLGRTATLLCVQRPGDGSVRLNGIDARPAVAARRWERAPRRNSS